MAANSILKLKVDNTEYDANIKKAAEGIQHLAKRMHDAQGDFEGLDKASLDFIKDLQYMTTSAKTASGQYRELENAYKNLAATYEGLNAFEKEGDAGKALAEQLEILKNRTLEMKANMDAASKSLNDNGQQAEQSSSALDALASKFTINIDAIKLFNVGLQAAEGALSIAKDAFFNNEEQLDEWGRTVQASEGLYQGFLNALNTGDISGYLSNIGNIIQAAREAYDALDALGTYNAFNQINIERTRTNMTESIADFRGGKGTKEGVKAAGDAYKKELADRQRLENEAYVAAVKEMAAKRGANAKDLMDALSGTYGHYQDLKNVQPSGTRTRYIPGLPGQAGRYEEYKVAQNNQERLGEALRHLNDTELQSLQALGAQAQRTGTEIAQVDKQLTRVLNAKQPGETTKSGKSGKSTKTEQTELQLNQTKINALTQEYVKLGDESTDAVRERQAEIQKEIALLQQRNGLLGLRAEQAQGRLTLGAGDFQRDGISNTPGTLMKAPDTTIPSGGLLLDDKAMKAVLKNIDDNLPKAVKKDSPMDGSKKMLNAISQLTGGLQQMGIELPSEIQGVISVIQGVMSVIEAVSTIIGITQTTALTANTAAMISLEAALWANTATSFIPFAKGGIVPGFTNGGVIDSGHSPAFLSFSKAAPAFATGGVVPQTITSIPKFATGGIIQKFATGGTVEAGHAPDFLSFSKAMPKFATGGTIPHANGGYFVGGTHYSSDVTPIMANAGELILNKVQQNTLAGMLSANEGMQNLNLTATIKGEQIRLALNNNGRRTGRGEYVQSSNRV